MTDEQQAQQCETLTTTTTESNLLKLLTVAELIFHIDLRRDGPPYSSPLVQSPSTPAWPPC